MTPDTSAPTPPSGIVGAAERLKSLRAEAQLVVEEVNAHVREHEAKIEAHKAEVAAAKKMLIDFIPGVDKKTAEAAAFVLTSPTWTQGLVRFVGRNWRILVFVGCGLVLWKMLA
jgi:hypothetical protein